MMKTFFPIIILFLFNSCMPLPEGVRQSLNLAGNNKQELKKVLRHYYRNQKEPLKFKAACFLVEHMKWHGNQTVTQYTDSTIPDIVRQADSLLYTFSKDLNMKKNEIRKKINAYAPYFQDSIHKLLLTPPTHIDILAKDLEHITSEFLITHIDHAFYQWKNSEYARYLSFNDFCEYLLPYRALSINSPILNGKALYDQVGKYLELCKPCTLGNIIDQYNFYLNQMRTLLGEKKIREHLGYYEMFFRKKFECVEQCELECNVLRAFGIPVALDINVGNREFVGQHHHCVIIDTLGHPHPFNGEAGFPKGKSWGYWAEIKLNIYRNLFGAQTNSPFLLKKPEEQIPDNFFSPCLKDVTSYIKEVSPLILSLERKTTNNLAWLYTYANNKQGLRAVTWGIVDSTGINVKFSHVVQDMLYFPAIIDPNGEPEFCHEPIYVTSEPSEKRMITIPLSHFSDQPVAENNTMLRITRKFPYKVNMKKQAENMIGGIFYGCNRKDEKDKQALYTITQAPGPYLNEFRLNNKKAWKYYIYEAPADRQARISILEFLTDTSTGYPKTRPATSLEIFKPENKNINQKQWVKIMPANESEEPEYDGNMQTTSGKKKIIFEAITPIVVQCIRMAPQNADNIIKPREDYELMVWQNGWKTKERKYSEFNYLEFAGLNGQQLYWLRNHTRGKEEVPFIIRNGEAAFIYYDLLQAPNREKVMTKLDNTLWTCKASSEEPENGPYEPGYARYALDNDPSTWWHSQYTGKVYFYPHRIKIDTRHLTYCDAFFIKPRGRDIPKDIMIEVSNDDKNWTIAGKYTLSDEGAEQHFEPENKLLFRYFRITFLNGYNKNPYTSIAEIGLLAYKSSKIE